MLIRNATLIDGSATDLRCGNGLIAEIGAGLRPRPGEPEIDARGGALLHTLHDHHIHFLAFAAARASVRCGPPQVNSAAELAAALQRHAARLTTGGWLRGVGYHPSVAGDIDSAWLDRHGPLVPLRIQHRSGRLWIFNSPGLQTLGEPGELSDSPLERIDGQLSGRLYDADTWLRQRLGGIAPDLHAASRELASYGVLKITDTTPGNNLATVEHFERLQAQGVLLQDVLLMGDESLHTLPERSRLRRGALKLHLHESALPDIDEVCERIRLSHAAWRPVAVHCVTLIELLFTLSAFGQAGSRPGDRIEHAAIAPAEVMTELVRLGLSVVTQPNFIGERGDMYAVEVDSGDLPWLYRLQGFVQAGVRLAGSTDAPFGDANPWRAMQDAVSRQTASGRVMGERERLTPEAALGLFAEDALVSASASDLGNAALRVGEPANLMVLNQPWRHARHSLADVAVLHTLQRGKPVWAA